MSDDTLPNRWIKEAVRAIDGSIAEWNKAHPKGEAVRLIWGFRDHDEAQLEKRLSATFRTQSGLLYWHGLDVKITLHRTGDPENLDVCRISADLPTPEPLPIGARELFDALQDCYESVRLVLVPAEDENRIYVVGVSTELLLENISARILGKAMGDLKSTYSTVWDRLHLKVGSDHWGQEGGFDRA